MKEKKFNVHPLLKNRRKDFEQDELLEEHCDENPFDLFAGWLEDALDKDSHYANAMTLSTVDQEGHPDSRIVLLKDISYGGLTFYTNYNSHKGQQIAAHPNASLLFFWKELERQVKIRGSIRFLPPTESETYFKSRPFESQVGAWASQQSEVIADRKSLDARYEQELQIYKDAVVPRPAHWGGYVLLPSSFEFWQGRKSRLHDRIRYTLRANEPSWKMERLMP